jgi:hypothetical protein
MSSKRISGGRGADGMGQNSPPVEKNKEAEIKSNLGKVAKNIQKNISEQSGASGKLSQKPISQFSHYSDVQQPHGLYSYARRNAVQFDQKHAEDPDLEGKGGLDVEEEKHEDVVQSQVRLIPTKQERLEFESLQASVLDHCQHNPEGLKEILGELVRSGEPTAARQLADVFLAMSTVAQANPQHRAALLDTIDTFQGAMARLHRERGQAVLQSIEASPLVEAKQELQGRMLARDFVATIGDGEDEGLIADTLSGLEAQRDWSGTRSKLDVLVQHLSSGTEDDKALADQIMHTLCNGGNEELYPALYDIMQDLYENNRSSYDRVLAHVTKDGGISSKGLEQEIIGHLVKATELAETMKQCVASNDLSTFPSPGEGEDKRTFLRAYHEFARDEDSMAKIRADMLLNALKSDVDPKARSKLEEQGRVLANAMLSLARSPYAKDRAFVGPSMASFRDSDKSPDKAAYNAVIRNCRSLNPAAADAIESMVPEAPVPKGPASKEESKPSGKPTPYG